MVKGSNHGELKIITVNIALEHLKYIQQLLDWGLVPSRSEYVRLAIANQLRRDFETKKYVSGVVEKKVGNRNMIRIPGYNGDKPVEIIRRLEY